MQIDNLKNFSKQTNGKLIFDYDLKKTNWLNIGGRAKAFFKPENLEGYSSTNAINLYWNGYDTRDECPEGYVQDCSDPSICVPDQFIGDDYADCGIDSNHFDLTCYAEQNCDCWETHPFGEDVILGITNYQDGEFEVSMVNSIPITGFQFDVRTDFDDVGTTKLVALSLCPISPNIGILVAFFKSDLLDIVSLKKSLKAINVIGIINPNTKARK